MANELSTKCQSSTESSEEHAKLLNSYSPTRNERLRACCKPTYHMRRLKNKGAITVLITTFLSVYLFYFIAEYDSHSKHHSITRTLCLITWSLTVPLVGWIADVFLNRYRILQWSMWIMWMGMMLSTASSVVAQLITAYQNIDKYMSSVLLIIATVGFGSYQVNALQFGLDQLQDAATDEITSFISWFVWAVISGGIMVTFVDTCTKNTNHILVRLLVCFCLSIALVLSLITKSLLIKEPVTRNPFKLVYEVVKYAINNKRPRCRSAFTYCEDDLPSRMDFGKSKYGGPFTTEQVEDVKTFFRLLSVVCLGCTLPGIIVMVDYIPNQISHLTYYDSHKIDKIACQMDKLYPLVTPLTVLALIIPLYEFAIYPVIRRHFSWVKSHLKFLVGVLLQIARVIALIALVLKSRHSYLEENGYNVTLQCIFHEEQGASILKFNSKLMLAPRILNCLSVAILAIGGGEFICAQTPYSMRGLMFGASYGTVAVLSMIGYGIALLFTRKITFSFGKGVISCEFWYLLLNIILLGFMGFVVAVSMRCYKKRKREDVLPNEQIFAERYYTS